MRQISEEEMNILKQMPDNVSGVTNVNNQPATSVEAQENTQAKTPTAPAEPSETEKLMGMLGKKVGYKQEEDNRTQSMQSTAAERGIRIGGNIFENADVRDGWQIVDRRLFGERNIYYPQDWEFRVRPATVEAIRNWSTIDDENANVVDDVFNEIIKSCFSIKTPQGLLPWGNLRSWDRFFILLLIRQYTFQTGDSKFEYTEDCPECDNPVTFVLNSTTLQYDLPDPEVMKYYDEETCTWRIDPEEYDVNGEAFTLYLPTLEKDANIKAWIIDRLQNKKKIDNVFIKFLPWMANRISKDTAVAAKQIKEIERKFKDLDADMFTFMNDVITNIMVTPSTKLFSKCPTCGEDVSTDIRFPNGVSELFNIKRAGKKFGKK